MNFKMLFTTILSLALWAPLQPHSLPQGFVYLGQVGPSIETELRYYTTNNFMGRQVRGYEAPVVIITEKAAKALQRVQNDLNKEDLGLKVFDAYRPQRAVDHFVVWAQDIKDTLKKDEYYPNLPKSELFERGYIAAKSSHSRGSTVDVTLVNLKNGQELDMGTPFDFFSPLSWPSSTAVSERARKNRMILQNVMERHGFEHLKTEWWHFTLREEPFPTTYFDFPVR